MTMLAGDLAAGWLIRGGTDWGLVCAEADQGYSIKPFRCTGGHAFSVFQSV